MALGNNSISSPAHLAEQARELWQNASAAARAAVIGGIAFLLILAIALSFWAGTPDFVPVFAGTPVEAQSVAREMDKAAIPYRLSEDGGQISVPRTSAGKARQVAGTVTGTTQGTQGLRGLDSLGPFTTYEQQRVRIERAQEEAIEQELAQYAGVAKVVVNLALPEQSLRVSPDNGDAPTKAAVTLAPLPGAAFDEAQIGAMAHVVAHSVPNLSPQNVTIASTDGATLWGGDLGPGEAATGPGGNNVLQTRTRAENQYIRARQAELQASLDRVFGPNKAIVYVDASLDLDKQETDAKRFVPAAADEGKGLVLSTETSTEQYSGGARTGRGAAGVVGSDANTPGAPTYPTATSESNGSPGNYKNTKETINYDNTEERVHIVKAIGEPKRLNVSALMDDKLPAATQTAIKTWLEGSVLNPANQNTTRVTVVAAAFDNKLAQVQGAARTASERRAWLAAAAPYVVLPACILLLLLGAFLLTRKKPVLVESAAGVLPGTDPATTDPALLLLDNMTGGQAAASLELSGGADSGALGPVPDGVIPLGDGSESLLSGHDAALPLENSLNTPLPPRSRAIPDKTDPELEVVLQFIDKRPEAAALLLRSWTTDEDRK